MNEMFELADRLKELKETKKFAEQEIREINADIEKYEYELSQMMAQTETQSFNRSGTLFYLCTKLYASANKEKKHELFEVLKAEGYGSLVTETVNANSLSSFVKEQMADNDDALPKWLEDKVNVFDKVTVGLRKSR